MRAGYSAAFKQSPNSGFFGLCDKVGPVYSQQ